MNREGKTCAQLVEMSHFLTCIMHELENLLCIMGDFYGQLNKLGTCFAFLAHSISTFLCSTMSMDSPD